MEGTQFKTCLSPKVHYLITKVGVDRVDRGLPCITTDGCINWNQACSCLPESLVSDDYDYFVSCVAALSPVFLEAEELMSSNQDIWIKHKTYLQWMPEAHLQMVEDALKFLKSSNESLHILGLQLMSSVLERALGDVYEDVSSIQCPSLLKDILSSGEITHLFGRQVVQLLRVLIGPPTSLNLRNVVWHGFPTVGEIPRRYGCFLYLTLPSLGKILMERDTHLKAHRQLVKFTINPELTSNVPVLRNNTHLVKEFVRKTHSFHGRQLLIQSSLELMAENQYSYATVLLLPQLEHVLRLVFCGVNGCSERVLTAESSTLYTTLDEIFDKYLPDGNVNKLPGTLGENLMDLLFDILVYPDGPRVRDKVSHGEAHMQNFPESLAWLVLVAMLLLVQKCSSITDHDKEEWLKRLTFFELQYSSVYHPISIIKQKIIEVGNIVATFPDDVQHDKTLTQRDRCSTFRLCEEDKQVFDEVQEVTKDIVLSICQSWDKHHTAEEINQGLFQVFCDGRTLLQGLMEENLSTLYRFHAKQEDLDINRTGGQEAEIASLLSRILRELQTVIQQVLVSLRTRQEQLIGRQLRSRQRENLIRLIRSCPLLHHCSHSVLLFCSWKLYTLSQYTGMRIIRFLKLFLQFVENMRTLTSPEKNKWTESIHLYREFIPKIRDILTVILGNIVSH
ncbi:endoplasmic reticulum membrane-associated RNA degradation protein-like isoform X2 [Ostrea edulis]|uniref:endoplasmic reticulum membrane-associated RNA degradation protein-like isoform X2 n=1 Tax=Ostrea edulis TaxID=37623 RepID=UPI0024AEF0DA|nr:endoplasmic reticulum membrane-associated RNA degradation protein-like isoform X2 [Ostrea edulis]